MVRGFRGRKTYTPEMKSQMVKDYMDGVTIREISEVYDVPHGTVYSLLYREGLKVPNGRVKVTVDDQDTVQHVQFEIPDANEEWWEIDFIGTIAIQAPSIYKALEKVGGAVKGLKFKKVTEARLLTK